MKDGTFVANAGSGLSGLMANLGNFANRLATDPEAVPLSPGINPGDIRRLLPAEPPQRGEALERVLERFAIELEPAINPWNHPGFLAFFGISTPPAALAGAFLEALYNSNAMLWKTSPAGTEISQVTADWVRQMIGLPDVFSGLFFESASVAVLHAMVGARERVTAMVARQRGLTDDRRLRAYVSSETHFSVTKAAIVAGIGIDNVRIIPADQALQMDVDRLECAIRNDLEAGDAPFFVVGTVGTTSTTSIDPIQRLGDLAERYGLWFHVDAAYGGMVAAVPEFRHVLAGCERADSITVNPHKHGFVPLGCSLLYVRELGHLSQIFRQRGNYTTSAATETFNIMDFTFGTGQPIRALPLWFVIMNYGSEGFVARIREHMRLGQLFRAWIEQADEFELLAPVTFSTIVFRARPADVHDEDELRTLNESLLLAFNGSHRSVISSTQVSGRFGLRLTIGNYLTDEAVLHRSWNLLQSELHALMPAVQRETLAAGRGVAVYPAWSYWARRARRIAALSVASPAHAA